MKLDKYVGQLIDDLRRVSPPPLIRPQATQESAEEHAQLLFRPNLDGPDDAVWDTLGEWLGLEAIQLPPVHLFKKSLLARFLDAVMGAVNQLNISFIFPHDLPLERRYRLFRDHLATEVPFSPTGQWTIDFCAGWYKGCTLEEYCTCRKEFGYGEEDPGVDEAEVMACLAPFFDLPDAVESDEEEDEDEDLLAADEAEELRYLRRLLEEEDGEEEEGI